MSEEKQVDPRTVAHPFTLPNGTPVILKHITAKDYEELDVWVRQQYMKNVTLATDGMNAVEKQELLMAALAYCAKLTFQYGDGRDILFGSAYGMSRLMYQMIQNPPFTFEQFRDMLFPEGFVNVEGMDLLGKMLSLTNTGEIQPDVDTLIEKIVEINTPVNADGEPDEVMADLLREDIKEKVAGGSSAMAQEAMNALDRMEQSVEELKKINESPASI